MKTIKSKELPKEINNLPDITIEGLVKNKDYVAQEYFEGIKILIYKNKKYGKIEVVDEDKNEVKVTSKDIAYLKSIDESSVLEGILGEKGVILTDILKYKGKVVGNLSFYDRQEVLKWINYEIKAITCSSEIEKESLISRLSERKSKSKIVFKKWKDPHGRPEYVFDVDLKKEKALIKAEET